MPATCANSERVPAAPNSTTAEIAAAKNAAIVMTTRHGHVHWPQNTEHRAASRRLLPADRRRDQRPGRGFVPLATRISAACSSRRRPNAAQGVEITIVYASHANNVPLSLLSEAQRANLAPDGTSIVLGPPATGYVVKFTNGLTAYLSGDTGIHTEMKTVVNEYHKANLAVLNLGPSAGIRDVRRPCDE